MLVCARASVYPNSLSLFGRKTFQEQIVQVDEAIQEAPSGVQLDLQPPFREIYLHDVCPLLQATADLALLLKQERIEVFLT